MVRLKEMIIEADYIVTCNPQNQILERAAVHVVDGRINAIGTNEDIHKNYASSKIIEGIS